MDFDLQGGLDPSRGPGGALFCAVRKIIQEGMDSRGSFGVPPLSSAHIPTTPGGAWFPYKQVNRASRGVRGYGKNGPVGTLDGRPFRSYLGVCKTTCKPERGTTDQMLEPEPSQPPPEIHGFPLWIRTSGAAVFVLLVISLARVSGVFHDAILVERAHRDLAQGNFRKVVEELGPVAERYPDSTDFALDLAEAKLALQDYAGAAKIMMSLEGREVTDEQKGRAEGIDNQIDAATSRLEEENK